MDFGMEIGPDGVETEKSFQSNVDLCVSAEVISKDAGVLLKRLSGRIRKLEQIIKEK